MTTTRNIDGARNFYLVVMGIIMTALLTGCLQNERTVMINPDGSGTIEEVVLISKMLEQIGSQMAGDGENVKKADPDKSKLEAEKEKATKDARKKIPSMGTGVDLVSVTPMQRGDFKGFRTVYSFKDINALKLSMGAKKDGQMDSADADNYTTFSYAKGENNTLVIKRKHAKAEAPAEVESTPVKPAETAEPGPQDQDGGKEGLEMLKNMFNGLRMTENILIQGGTVVESNASFRSGSLITLLEVDFTKLLDSNPMKLQEFAGLMQGTDQMKTMTAMSKVEGFKVDMNEELKIVFRKSGK